MCRALWKGHCPQKNDFLWRAALDRNLRLNTPFQITFESDAKRSPQWSRTSVFCSNYLLINTHYVTVLAHCMPVHPLSSVSWDYFPNKPLVLKYVSQGLIWERTQIETLAKKCKLLLLLLEYILFLLSYILCKLPWKFMALRRPYCFFLPSLWESWRDNYLFNFLLKFWIIVLMLSWTLWYSSEVSRLDMLASHFPRNFSLNHLFLS